MTPTAVVLQALVTEWTWETLLRVLGFGLYASVVAVGTAFVYRWYTTRPIDPGTTALVAVALVAVAVNLEGYLTGAYVPDTRVQSHLTGLYLLGVFAASALAGEVGRRIGDHTACDVFGIDPIEAPPGIAALLRSGGISVAVTLPETIEDADGYPPVAASVKRDLAGRTLLFPRRLAVEELRDRLADRLARDYPVGHVHVEFDESGSVSYLALGRQPSGIGTSLPSGTVAAAVRADPPAGATSGDPVELWAVEDGEHRLVATGTFRANVGDVTTVALDADDADALSEGGPYRLVTPPEQPDHRDDLVSVLRSADETVTRVTVESGGHLEGEFAGWLPATVLVVERSEEVVPFPEDRETLRAGDTVYVLGTPADLHDLAQFERERKDERAAPRGDDGDGTSSASGASEDVPDGPEEGPDDAVAPEESAGG